MGSPIRRNQLQSFIGSTNFYHDFLPNFTKEALPLTDLLKTKRKGQDGAKLGAKMKWTPWMPKSIWKVKSIVYHRAHSLPPRWGVKNHNSGSRKMKMASSTPGHMCPNILVLQKGTGLCGTEAATVKLALSTWCHLLEGSQIPFEIWSDQRNLEALLTPSSLGT